MKEEEKKKQNMNKIIKIMKKESINKLRMTIIMMFLQIKKVLTIIISPQRFQILTSLMIILISSKLNFCNSQMKRYNTFKKYSVYLIKTNKDLSI